MHSENIVQNIPKLLLKVINQILSPYEKNDGADARPADFEVDICLPTRHHGNVFRKPR